MVSLCSLTWAASSCHVKPSNSFRSLRSSGEGLTPTLHAKLKKADSEVKLYVSELKKENARLQLQIAKYEVKQMSLENRIKALEKEVKENKPEPFQVTLSSYEELSEEELIAKAETLGYRMTKISSG